jgi:uncharacterized protein (UPF0147 family)
MSEKISQLKEKIAAIQASIDAGSDLDSATIGLMNKSLKNLKDKLAAEEANEVEQVPAAKEIKEEPSVDLSDRMAGLSEAHKKEAMDIQENMELLMDVINDESVPEEDRQTFKDNYAELESSLNEILSKSSQSKASTQEGIEEQPAAAEKKPEKAKPKLRIHQLKRLKNDEGKKEEGSPSSAARSKGRPSKYPEPKYMTEAEIIAKAEEFKKDLSEVKPVNIILTQNEINSYKAREAKKEHSENLVFLAKKTRNEQFIGIAIFVKRANEKIGSLPDELYDLSQELNKKLRYELGKSTRGRKPGSTKSETKTINEKKEEIAAEKNVSKEDIIMVDGVAYNMDDCEEAIRGFYAKKEQQSRASAEYQSRTPAEKAENNLVTAFKQIFKTFDNYAIQKDPKAFKNAINEAKAHLRQFITVISKYFDDKGDAKVIREALDEIQRQMDLVMERIE